MRLLLPMCAMQTAVAQDVSEESILNKILPPSPQAAALASYGDYPVSHTSGLPDISIPLYEIKCGEFVLPISISYHSSGARPDEVATYVGLGWSLNAGGAIVRSVCGAPDGTGTPQETRYYSIDELESLKARGHNGGDDAALYGILYDPFVSQFDTESDSYSYNFNGKSGVFRYDYVNDRYLTVNYSPMSIQREESSAVGSYEGARTTNKHCFVIDDTDGIQYVFDDREYTGIVDDEDLADASAWYLSYILTPNGTIKFNYVVDPKPFYTSTISESVKLGKILVYDEECACFPTFPAGAKPSIQSSYHFSKNIFRQLQLQSIEWPGGRVDFSYDDVDDHICPHRLASMSVRSTFAGNDVVRVVEFSHELWGGEKLANRLLLKAVTIDESQKFSFDYDKSRTLPTYVDATKFSAGGWSGSSVKRRCNVDKWGYFNGKSTEHFVPTSAFKSMRSYALNEGFATYVINWIDDYFINANSSEREPDVTYAKLGMLKKITYPTGGWTTLEYGQNKLNENYLVGGLRIEKMSSYDSDGTLTKQKSYRYDGRDTYDVSTNTWYYVASLLMYGNWAGVPVAKFFTCVSNPMDPLHDNTGCAVFYNTVSETDLDGSKVTYQYSNGDELHGYWRTTDEHFPELSNANINDLGNASPLLLSKSYADADGNVLKTESYNYNFIISTMSATSLVALRLSLMSLLSTIATLPARSMVSLVRASIRMSRPRRSSPIAMHSSSLPRLRPIMSAASRRLSTMSMTTRSAPCSPSL